MHISFLVQLAVIAAVIAVIFSPGNIEGYPDEACKPPAGEGLNKECEVTLFNVWPQETKQSVNNNEVLYKYQFILTY